jgi:hypothetical protein
MPTLNGTVTAQQNSTHLDMQIRGQASVSPNVSGLSGALLFQFAHQHASCQSGRSKVVATAPSKFWGSGREKCWMQPRVAYVLIAGTNRLP